MRIDAAFGLTRDELARVLDAEGVQTRAYYVPVVHKLTAFAHLRERSNAVLPQTNRLEAQVLTFPGYGSLTDDDVTQVARRIRAAHQSATDVRRALNSV